MIVLSSRLQAICSYVPNCELLIDVGTDHAYVPASLIETGVVKKAIAADISPGSIYKAAKQAELCHMQESIECRCGNGLTVLHENEYPQCIVITGMGGVLITDILKGGMTAVKRAEQIILQPQRDMDKVRRFVHSAGLCIVDEQLLCESGKYYNIIVCENGTDCAYTESEYFFGRINIKRKSRLLKEYIDIELKKIHRSIEAVSNFSSNTVKKEQLLEKERIYREVYECL